ncbi:MAG: hypothetical protein IK085_02220 [Clostridia bacterium]|nr:hypothetical protein [Clostridia bacterium]
MSKTSKVVVRTVSVILIAVTVITLCFSGSAQSEPIYYSDLFYGYNSSYLNSGLLQQHQRDNDGVMRQVLIDYLDSDDSVWLGIKTALKAATDLGEMVTLVSDAFLDTDFSYWDALDGANEEFAKELLSDDAKSNYSNLNVGKKITKRSKKIIKIFNEWAELHGNSLNSEDLDEWIDFFKTTGSNPTEPSAVIYECLSPAEIDALINETIISGIYEDIDHVCTLFEVATSVTLALAIEDVRMEIIDAIIESSDGSGYLYDGMTRLKDQLYGGWVTYFLYNYGKEKFVKKLSSIGTKAMEGTITHLALATAIVEVASWIFLDVILDTPSLNDVLTQQALDFYSRDLYQCMLNKAESFNEQFDSGDIEEYEDLFDAYLAATSAGLKKSEDLLIFSNDHMVSSVRSRYESFSYDSYVEDIKDTISDQSLNERNYCTITDWDIEMPVVFHSASDEVKKGEVYLFKNAFRGNVNLYGSGNIESDISTLVFSGDLTSYDGIDLNGHYVIVNGDASISNLVMQNADDYLLVNGDLSVYNGGILNDGNGNNDSYYCQMLSAGTVEVKGNFTADYYYESGTHRTVLSGNDTQEVNFNVYIIDYSHLENFIPENSDICFVSDIPNWTLKQNTVITNDNTISIYADLNLNGYNLTAAGYVSCNCLIGNGGSVNSRGLYAEGISSIGGNCTINGSFSAGSLEMNSATITVNGDASISNLVMQNADDYLLVNGDLSVYNGGILNDGNGNNNSYYCQMLSAGTVEVKGNFTADYYYESGTHRTVLSGDSTQTVHFDNPADSHLENFILENSDIYFNGEIPDWTLSEDTTITNENDLLFHNNLDLNGYTLTAAGYIHCNSLIGSGGNVNANGGLWASSIYDLGGNCIVNGDLYVDNNIEFNNSSLTVNGNADIHGLVMQNADDYLLVNGDCYINNYNTSYDSLSAGTVEIKGNFNATYYYESGSHRTVLSGDSTQTVHFDNPPDSHLENFILENSDIYFDGEIPNWTLMDDFEINGTVSVAGILDLNGYDLYIDEPITYQELIKNGGHIINKRCRASLVKVEAVPATCTESGSIEYWLCTHCGNKYEDQLCYELLTDDEIVIEPFGHFEAEPVTENEIDSTCISEGSYDIVVYCFECGEELSRETVILDYADHTASPFVVENETASTCIEEGEYDEVIYCSVCGEELGREHKIKELGVHVPLEAIKENENYPTCTQDGCYEAVVYCGICGEELSRESMTSSATGHSFVNYVFDGNATCTENGTKTAKCEHCDVTDTIVAENTAGHKYGSWSEWEEQDNGDSVRHRECKKCGHQQSQTVPAWPESNQINLKEILMIFFARLFAIFKIYILTTGYPDLSKA